MDETIVKRAVAGFVADHMFRGKRILQARSAQTPFRSAPAWMLHEIGAADYFSRLLSRVPYDLLDGDASFPTWLMTGYHRKRVAQLVDHVEAGTTPRQLLPAVARTFTGQQVVAFRLQNEPWLINVADLELTGCTGRFHGALELSDAAVDVVARLLLGLQSDYGQLGGDR